VEKPVEKVVPKPSKSTTDALSNLLTARANRAMAMTNKPETKENPMVMAIHAATMVAADRNRNRRRKWLKRNHRRSGYGQEPEADQAAVTAGNSTDVNSPTAANKFRIATNLAP
jgi:hypothetical protein